MPEGEEGQHHSEPAKEFRKRKGKLVGAAHRFGHFLIYGGVVVLAGYLAFRFLKDQNVVLQFSVGAILVGLLLSGFAFPEEADGVRQQTKEAAEGSQAGKGYAYPSGKSQETFFFVLLLSSIFLVGLIFLLNDKWVGSIISDRGSREALVTLVAGGVGSAIRTMMGFLKHASTKKDFENSFLPWYVLRPIIGAMLALLFYYLLAGGLIALVPDDGQGRSIGQLKLEGLAAIGGLVGFFSREAIYKLSDVFKVLFSSESRPEEGGEDKRDKE